LTVQVWQPGIGVFVQPLMALQASVVHALPSLQLSAGPGVQTPLWQVSAPLQTVLSAHDVPLGTATFWHPTTGSQLSVVQTLLSLQLSAVPAAQTPLWHVSLPLQTVPSAHGVPFRTGTWVHPKAGSQLSVVQTLESLQLSAVPGVHAPFWQVSLPLQTLPSVHELPLATLLLWQPAIGSQLSAVHGLPSLQLRAVPVVQVPAWQVSAPLHTLPSAHDVPLVTLACWQPSAGVQESVVQTLLSSQLGAVPAVQTPA
jgi:hypothetical protein